VEVEVEFIGNGCDITFLRVAGEASSALFFDGLGCNEH
jgi:hypothetical protein